MFASAARAQDASYPEGQRFNTARFHKNLKKRGLTDLLALHLVEHPPSDPITAVLLARDVKLAEAADPSRSARERDDALAAADRLLEQLIDDQPNDARVRTWRIELSKALLYTEGDRLTSNLLYKGGGDADRAKLRPLMERAVAVTEALYNSLQSEYDALDAMSARQYEQLETSGDVRKLEADFARTGYMLAWARFYRALAQDTLSQSNIADLTLVLDYLITQSNLVNIPHAETHYRAQALLLAGMTHRLMGEYRKSVPFFERAIEVVSNILSDNERHALAWVQTLARIEQARAFAGAEDFAAAGRAVEALREEIYRRDPNNVGLSIIAALLDRSVLRARATQASHNGRTGEAAALRDKAVVRLSALAAQNVAYRNDIYAILGQLINDDSNIDTLTPFERCAVLADLLGQASTMQQSIAQRLSGGLDPADSIIKDAEDQRAGLLQKAVDIASPILDPDFKISPSLAAEAAFNLGVAQHLRGRRLDAAQAFLQVAERFPSFDRAAEAATLAVQLAWNLYQDPALAARPEVKRLCLDALTTLTTTYPETDAGRYWQFFFAQHLSEIGRTQDAATAYAAVSPSHPRYFDAVFLAAESRATAVKQLAAGNPDRPEEVSRKATPAIAAIRAARKKIFDALEQETDTNRKDELSQLAARAEILIAELYVLTGVNRWQRALDTVNGFETHFANQHALFGRALRARMLALEGLHRSEEASQLIPQYVSTDPIGAATTLQGLFDSLHEEIQRDQTAGRIQRAKKRSESAYVIAQGLYDLAGERSDLFDASAVYALRLQLARSALEKEDYDRAKSLFEQCYNENAARYADHQPRDSRAIQGVADTYFAIANYADALPLYNTLFRAAKPGDRSRWTALLRDLQCRTELDYDPKEIIKSIEQQKFFDREMGGSNLRRRFDALLTTNERRAEQASPSPKR